MGSHSRPSQAPQALREGGAILPFLGEDTSWQHEIRLGAVKQTY